MMERKEIANKDLTERDIPNQDADWDDIVPFALSFNGYEYCGSTGKCIGIANKHSENYEKDGVLPSTLTELRTCLFAEQRRVKWTTVNMAIHLNYMRNIIEAIRKKVASKELD
jgi:hypothetical protein